VGVHRSMRQVKVNLNYEKGVNYDGRGKEGSSQGRGLIGGGGGPGDIGTNVTVYLKWENGNR